MVLSGIDKVIALEINPKTAKCAKQFIGSLGLSESIDIQLADATEFVPDYDVQLLLSENMHTGLFFEPQLHIVKHLGQFLSEGGVVVPESVNLSLALALADWQVIGKPQAELRNAGQVMINGGWGFLPTVDFKALPTDGTIKGCLPASSYPVNALAVAMDVKVSAGNVIKSGQAEFLGQPHLVQINSLEPGKKDFGFFHYQAGGSPPGEIFLF